MLIVVVLPAPLGPINRKTPFFHLKDIESVAKTSAYRFVTSVNSIAKSFQISKNISNNLDATYTRFISTCHNTIFEQPRFFNI